ncbi:hypothetical protein MA16_Dca012984 [Dendrobium catenatum]|uniref:SURP motif domain-containing protein n=1 Tax=Dendrobium catenatum TaxID=906689 RepID=A0A2I0VUP7_9ASPA|nr:hypothetical protein MA16_Dca012984 [Dendrobium catenatum]
MEKEEEQVLQLSGVITMEELEEEEEEVYELLEDEYDDDEAPIDRSACDRIEKIAAVVAWNPSAELFLNQLMFGDEQFDFMFPGHEHYAYYWHRIAVLGRRPRLLYS